MRFIFLLKYVFFIMYSITIDYHMWCRILYQVICDIFAISPISLNSLASRKTQVIYCLNALLTSSHGIYTVVYCTVSKLGGGVGITRTISFTSWVKAVYCYAHFKLRTTIPPPPSPIAQPIRNNARTVIFRKPKLYTIEDG